MLRVDANLPGKLVAQTFAQAVPTLLNGLIVMGKIGIIRRIDQKRMQGSFLLWLNRFRRVEGDIRWGSGASQCESAG